VSALWLPRNQRAIAGLGVIQDYFSAHAVTIPAGPGLIRVVHTTEYAHDVIEFASRQLIGAKVAPDGSVYVEVNFAGAVLRVQDEPKVGPR
jgi:hypothetical protein